MPPQPKSKGSSKGAAAGGAKGKAGKKAGVSTPPPVVLQPVIPPPIQEDVWVQCDLCNKWRRLPPGTELEDDAPWDCTLNPDPQRNSCAAPEEDYDASKEVVTASNDPFYANLVPKDAEALKRELLEKAGLFPDRQLQPPAPKQASSAKQRKGTPEPGFGAPLPFYGSKKQQHYQPSRLGAKDQGAAKGPTLKEELEQLVKALQQIMANAGSWDASSPQSVSSPPAWVWQALSHLVPEALQEAVFAFEALSAARCMCHGSSAQQAAQAAAAAAAAGGEAASASGAAHQPSAAPGSLPPQHTTTLSQLDALARLALLTAVSLALPRVQQAQAQQQAKAQQLLLAQQQQTSMLLDPTPYAAPAAAGSSQPLNRQHSVASGATQSLSQASGAAAQMSGLAGAGRTSQSPEVTATPQQSGPAIEQSPSAFHTQQGVQPGLQQTMQPGTQQGTQQHAGAGANQAEGAVPAGLHQSLQGLQNQTPPPPGQPSPGLTAQQQRMSPTQLAQLGMLLGAAGKQTAGLQQQQGMNGVAGLNPLVLQALQLQPQQLQAALAAGLLPGLQQQLQQHLRSQASQQLPWQQQQQQQAQQPLQQGGMQGMPGGAALQAALLNYQQQQQQQQQALLGQGTPAQAAANNLPTAGLQGMLAGAAPLPQQMQQLLQLGGGLGLTNQGQMLPGQQTQQGMMMPKR